jgi:hypothetical protein
MCVISAYLTPQCAEFPGTNFIYLLLWSLRAALLYVSSMLKQCGDLNSISMLVRGLVTKNLTHISREMKFRHCSTSS